MTTVEMILVYNFHTNFVSLDFFFLSPSPGLLGGYLKVKKKNQVFVLKSYQDQLSAAFALLLGTHTRTHTGLNVRLVQKQRD